MSLTAQDPAVEGLEFTRFRPVAPTAAIDAEAPAVWIDWVRSSRKVEPTVTALAHHASLRHVMVTVIDVPNGRLEKLPDPRTGWLAPLAGCSNLRSLRALTDQDWVGELTAFQGHTSLATISIHHFAAWEPSDTDILTGLPALRRLSLHGVRHEADQPTGLESLARLEHLEELALHRLTGFDVVHQRRLGRALSGLENLRDLAIGVQEPVDEPRELSAGFLNDLADLPSLSRLGLFDVGYLEDGILDHLPNRLEHLALDGTSVVEVLRRPGLLERILRERPGLDSLTLLPGTIHSPDRFDAETAAELDDRLFRRLHLKGPITPSMARFLADQTLLEELTLSGYSQGVSGPLDWVAELPSLRILRLQSGGLERWLQDTDLEPLAKAPRLRRLVITSRSTELLEHLEQELPDHVEVLTTLWLGTR